VRSSRRTPEGLWKVSRRSRGGRLYVRASPGTGAVVHHPGGRHCFVFCQPNGRPIDARRDWLDWKALLKAAGIRDARLHDARHTAATLLLQQGVPARVVMEILGHSQISLTLGTYSYVVPELAHEGAERMGDALWS
jgi:integrase